MKRILFVAVFVQLSLAVVAQEMKKEHQKVVSDFINQVKHREVEKISGHVSFPFKRAYPLAEVKNKKDFIKRYREIFDDKLVEKISKSKPNSDWSAVGWRGIMLFNGDVWLDYDGKLLAINYQSKFEIKKRDSLIKSEKIKLHPSVRNFKAPVYLIETPKYRIRIDDLGNFNYRYSSWPLKSKISNKPDLVIENGEYIPQGSGGNHVFRFKNNGYTYDCEINALGEGNFSPAVLAIYKADKKISRVDAKIITN